MRHVWRMGVAFFIASGSFFPGQADQFPEAVRLPALPAIPALPPLVVMATWLRRLSRGGSPPWRGAGAPP